MMVQMRVSERTDSRTRKGLLRDREETDVARSRVDTYIQSSLRTAFVQPITDLMQRMELADSGRLSSKNQNTSTPVLSILKWRSLAAGVAVAALPSCYGDELKEFILNTTELTPDTDEVLKAADKYGGKSLLLCILLLKILSIARMGELDPAAMEMISNTVPKRLVLLADGPFRAFSRQDSEIIEDFRLLKEIYLAAGAGLP
ncbi:hypothetical protein MUK42_35870 [Musa troglodytarum]|uniref:PATROL1-like C-terminal domain-containing protein n=1 Tax=Musa troglodytarum TaxID=320322 RepID=A0A9E7KVX5_9LILI|nr:hypothetical protein MUK42_35870 [Musa troglodytarum]